MLEAVDTLVLNLLEWIESRARAYAEAMEAWRTSCPRLPVWEWEEAASRGFVAQRLENGRGVLVSLTESGSEYLRARRFGG